MSEITDTIKRYKDGKLTLVELADRLAAWNYAEPSLYQGPPPESRMSAEEWSREHLGLYPEEGTWQEVEAARLDGVLTDKEYWFLHSRVDQRQQR